MLTSKHRSSTGRPTAASPAREDERGKTPCDDARSQIQTAPMQQPRDAPMFWMWNQMSGPSLRGAADRPRRCICGCRDSDRVSRLVAPSHEALHGRFLPRIPPCALHTADVLLSFPVATLAARRAALQGSCARDGEGRRKSEASNPELL